MKTKILIEKDLDITYSKFLYEVLECDKHLKHLDRVFHIVNPHIDYDQLTERNILKKRKLFFKYPIPIFLNLIVGDSFEIKVIETTVLSQTRCSVNCDIKIETFIGKINMLETAIYTPYGKDKIHIKIALNCDGNHPNLLIQNVIKSWTKDRHEYLNKILNAQ